MKITEFIKDNLLYLDGGMGTLLQAKGLAAGELPERWNISRPEVITEIHRSYYDAGSHVVNTNTFGANIRKFSAEELDNIVRAAVENARRAMRESSGTQPKWVALDIGPTGRMLMPYGDLDFEDAVACFAETVKLGVKYGVDLIMIETMNDIYETKAALLAAKENSDLPVFVSNAYEESGKLMTGASPAAMIAMLEGMGADAVGMNCSFGPKTLAKVAEEYLRRASVPVLLKPNAGLPRTVDGKTVYDVPPEEFAADVSALIRRGVRIAGGCCGTTPAYITALHGASADIPPAAIEPKTITCVSSYSRVVDFGDEPILIGERINPTGKKAFREALLENDIDYILNEGEEQADRGVHILDVNVGMPGIDETEMLVSAVGELQTILNLPLQIDTTDPAAMEAALRRYNGKAMINSVSGKKESLDAILPLAKKYGGMLVALTLDENGIPADACGRVAIARRILAEAEKYGIAKKDIIFDPLALAVSADSKAAAETLRAVRMIREELGCHTILGISNISYGLPARDLLNSTFFAMALGCGLSAAIMNPYSDEMMKTYHTCRTLLGQDENCGGYIALAKKIEKTSAPDAPSAASALQNAIVKGMKEQAAQCAETLLADREPMRIVQEEIIPALDTVGKGFEENALYLPQLLMSAEAAKSAFAVIRNRAGAGEAHRCAVVLATVKGDIHDIGKNIVKLLLENYGFAVTDLGHDVAPEVVAAEVVRLHGDMSAYGSLFVL